MDRPDLIPRISQHVKLYTATLFLLGRTRGTKQMESWKVEKVQRLKSTKISRHELLLAYLTNSEKKLRIVFERVGGEVTSDGSSAHLDSPPLIQQSKSSSSSSCQDLSAVDIVYVFEGTNLPKDTVIVGTVTFTDVQDRPSLVDLALLAKVVHDAHPWYLLFSDNCYHYSGTILYVLRSKYPSEMAMADAAGKWYRIDLGEPTSQKVALLRSAWEEQVTEFVSCFLC
jgi:hypothetical protein